MKKHKKFWVFVLCYPCRIPLVDVSVLKTQVMCNDVGRGLGVNGEAEKELGVLSTAFGIFVIPLVKHRGKPRYAVLQPDRGGRSNHKNSF
uniref:Putative secreted protein n=1 Tax=Ixodes ricinus TaxID=34613 RepID=A0A6B0UBH7_IXORI